MRELVEVVGVHFRFPEKIYYYLSEGIDPKIGDTVITKQDTNIRIGTVIKEKTEVDKSNLDEEIGVVQRIASKRDLDIALKNKDKEKEFVQICCEKAKKMNLEMKVVDCEYFHDKKKILFYFTSEGRVDFRELVKELGASLHARIQMLQIGARDEVKILGGLGSCGREVCCNKFIREFSPVTIRMAKDQNLALNQTKISGACGRLMCCLAYEEENYELLNMSMPRRGSKVKTKDGITGIVDNINVLKQKVRIIVDSNDESKRLVEYDAKDIIFNKQDTLSELIRKEASEEDEYSK